MKRQTEKLAIQGVSKTITTEMGQIQNGGRILVSKMSNSRARLLIRQEIVRYLTIMYRIIGRILLMTTAGADRNQLIMPETVLYLMTMHH